MHLGTSNGNIFPVLLINERILELDLDVTLSTLMTRMVSYQVLYQASISLFLLKSRVLQFDGQYKIRRFEINYCDLFLWTLRLRLML